jgi:membrane-bound lytic murein transglycosylase B
MIRSFMAAAAFGVCLLCSASPVIAAPVRKLDVKEPQVKAFIKDVHCRDAFSALQLRRLLHKAEIKQSIIDAANRPAERVLEWRDYRDLFVNEGRIQPGVEFSRAQSAAIQQAAARGVPSFVMLGILGAETRFGKMTGRYRVIDALATRAFAMETRAEFFRTELEEFLLLTREEKLDPLQVKGSYSGAMGAGQFMPSSFRKFAVDADGDGHRDLWNDWNDVLGSIANFLIEHGWHSSESILVDAALPDNNVAAFDVGTLALNETVGSLRSKGAMFRTTASDETPAMLIAVQGKQGPEYHVGFNNFYVITRYNRSILYALAVHDLGLAIEAAARPAGLNP